MAGASPVVSPGRVSQKEIDGGKSPTKRRRTKSPVERVASQGTAATVAGASPVSSSESQKEARTGKPPAKRLRTNAPPGKQGKRGIKVSQFRVVFMFDCFVCMYWRERSKGAEPFTAV